MQFLFTCKIDLKKLGDALITFFIRQGNNQNVKYLVVAVHSQERANKWQMYFQLYFEFEHNIELEDNPCMCSSITVVTI
jgi:hypothetical protein